MTSLAGAGYRAWGGMRDTAGRNAARKAALEACAWVWRTTRQWQLPPLASRQRHVTTLMWGTPAPRSVAGKAAGQGRTRLAVGMEWDATEVKGLSRACRARCGMQRN